MDKAEATMLRDRAITHPRIEEAWLHPVYPRGRPSVSNCCTFKVAAKIKDSKTQVYFTDPEAFDLWQANGG